MKVTVIYEVDNSDGYYNVPAEAAYANIIEAIINDIPIHGFENIEILLND